MDRGKAPLFAGPFIPAAKTAPFWFVAVDRTIAQDNPPGFYVFDADQSKVR
jgi:hypothetical protein